MTTMDTWLKDRADMDERREQGRVERTPRGLVTHLASGETAE
jgi:hypothetical protein